MMMPLNAEELKQSLAECNVPEGSRLAIAVSGGPDSLALVLLASEVADVVCLTVNHGLREEAANEVAYVEKVMKSAGIPFQALEWKGEKPTGNVQAKARLARYQLMGTWCSQNNVKYLLTAHHQNDQAETLLLRLARGSGVYGLAAMAPVTSLPGTQQQVKLIRPFLNVSKKRLVTYLRHRGVAWVDDPSNKALQFDRVKVRELLTNPPLEGFNVDRLAGTAARLRRTRDALEFYENEWMRRAVVFCDNGTASFNIAELSTAPDEIVFRGIATLCRSISGERYVPRMEKLERAVGQMKSDEFTGLTLYGVQFSPTSSQTVLAFRELRAVLPRIPLKSGSVWDKRFEISAEGDTAGLEVGALGQDGWEQAVGKWPQIRDVKMPFAAKLVCPAVFKGESVQMIPHLGVADDGGLGVTLSLRTNSWPKK